MFEYKAEIPSADGQTTEKVVLSFQPINLLPIGILRKYRDSMTEQMWRMFEWGLSADQLELFDRVPTTQLREIREAWENSDQVSLGESEASSTSSTGTGRRSKRTSSETDSD